MPNASGSSRGQRRGRRGKPARLRCRGKIRYRHRRSDSPEPGGGWPNRDHYGHRVHRWLYWPGLDIGRRWHHEAAGRRLVSHRHAAAACKAGGERVVHGRTRSDCGEDYHHWGCKPKPQKIPSAPHGSAATVSVLPEVIEAIGCELSVDGGVLDVPVPEVMLDGAGVLAVVG